MPTDFRQLICDRLEHFGKSRYWLQHHGALEITPTSVSRFLGGHRDSHGESIAQMMEVVGLKVVPIEGFTIPADAPRKPRPRPAAKKSKKSRSKK